ncbi:ABC transporter substrate-binding protein [Aquabacter sp. CN5-332]|uniref:ABC transporter substrate-binding protein n=1 Tax=Aquabacter sp. CN5-332 TaxID=3156608 RepID=UPI0032B547F9
MKLAIPDKVSNSYFPAIAAIELGYFKEEGLDVELELIFPPNKSYEAMRDGTVDLVAASAHAGLGAFPNWEGLKLICAQAQGMYWFLVMHTDLGVKRGEIEAVKGRSIGAAPWVELGLRRLLKEVGLDPVRDDIRIAPVPKGPSTGPNFGLSAAQGLADKRVDGFWANGMAAEVAVRHGFGTVVLDLRRGEGPKGAFDYTFASVAASDKVLAANPGLAGAVTRAIKKTHAALKADLTLATKIGRALFPPAEAELIADLIQRDLPYFDTTISRETVAGLNGFARDMGLLTKDVSYEQVVAA